MTAITGYRELTHDEIAKVNEIKAKAEELGRLIDGMETASHLQGGLDPDRRWLALGRTNLQVGFMCLTRAITKPLTF